INLKLGSDNLLSIDVEDSHRKTQYHNLYLNSNCSLVTDTLCQTNDALYELIKDLLLTKDNHGYIAIKDNGKSVQIQIQTQLKMLDVNDSKQLRTIKLDLKQIAQVDQLKQTITKLQQRLEHLEH
ncbi:unnamed protein product, partial [Didymodactylos carnosus]